MAIDPSKVKWDSAPDPRMVKWDDEKPLKEQYTATAKKELLSSLPVQLGLGAIRGAGSIGATIKAPFDYAEQGIAKLMGADMPAPDRRKAMDEALQSMGADPSSVGYNVGKIGSEIAGTAGIGGILARGAESARLAPSLVDALRTGGMSAAGKTGIASIPARVVGAATVGGASAGAAGGLNDVGMGAAIGGALPVVGMAASNAGQYLGQRAASKAADAAAKFERSAPLRETVKAAVDSGYVIPPNMVSPSFKNALVESVSGKQATSQLASVRNQDVTDKLVRSALGASDDSPLTKGALEKMRGTAGKAYAEVSSLSPAAKMDLEALKQARNDSQAWFKAYNRTASPDDLSKAKAFRDIAESLESNLENYAAQAGREELIPALREARKQIAKTYTVERALNDSTGAVNAKVLGRMYDKGAPLSGGLEQVGRFANAFPSINQAGSQMGSPAAHNLRAVSSVGLGLLGAGAGGVPGIAAAALPYAGSAAARSIMFSKGAQNALANQSAPNSAYIGLLADLMSNPQAQLMLNRSAPVISAQ